jgi:hypothetical protein
MIFDQLTQVNNGTGVDSDWVANVGPKTAADAAIFSDVNAMNAAGYFDGLTSDQRAEVVNWALNIAPVPTLSPLAMTGMAGAIGLTGLGVLQMLRRRRYQIHTTLV